MNTIPFLKHDKTHFITDYEIYDQFFESLKKYSHLKFSLQHSIYKQTFFMSSMSRHNVQ